MLIGDLAQPGPVGIPTGQPAFHILLTEPPYDRLPRETPHIDVHEGDITSGASSESCVLATLFATPGGLPGQCHTEVVISERTCG